MAGSGGSANNTDCADSTAVAAAADVGHAGTVLAHVGLGSNLAQPARQVAAAMHRLAAWPGVSRFRGSRLYRSPPWGLQSQPDFINAVASFHYSGSAPVLLAGLLAIEREAGRVRGGERWGPRVLDLDLLDFAGQRIELPGLSLPHPRIAERAFVLLPLHELSPDLHLPGLGPVAMLAAKVDRQGVAALD